MTRFTINEMTADERTVRMKIQPMVKLPGNEVSCYVEARGSVIKKRKMICLIVLSIVLFDVEVRSKRACNLLLKQHSWKVHDSESVMIIF